MAPPGQKAEPPEDTAVRRIGAATVVTMPTEIDDMNADEIRDVLLSAAGPGVTNLIIDMSRTTFCDSAGVHAVIAIHRAGGQSGIQVRLVAVAVLRVFALVGADLLMPIYSSLEAALADVPSGPAGPSDPGKS